MANDWIDGDPDCQNADHPFHAGVTVDLLEGNLLRALEQSGYDLQCFHHETMTMAYTFTADNAYEDLRTVWTYPMIVMRRKADGSWRDIKFSLEGKTSDGSKASVRLYLLRWITFVPAIDVLNEFNDTHLGFGTVDFEDSSYAVDSATITPHNPDVGGNRGWDRAATTPDHLVSVCIVQATASGDIGVTLTMRAPRFTEVVV